MNVATLELCKELYELSGWAETEWYRHSLTGTMIAGKDKIYRGSDIPAYDLGYLLRKLQLVDIAFTMAGNAQGFYAVRLDFAHDRGWYCGLINLSSVTGQYADTPEDAACKLAIELFKQGILTKGIDVVATDKDLK